MGRSITLKHKFRNQRTFRPLKLVFISRCNLSVVKNGAIRIEVLKLQDSKQFASRNKPATHFAGSAKCCRMSKKLKKMFLFCFPLILRIISSPHMYCNRTICFRIRIIKFKFCCNNDFTASSKL